MLAITANDTAGTPTHHDAAAPSVSAHHMIENSRTLDTIVEKPIP
ncbi:MAG: hypothetical protein PVH86_04485 [Thiogranum sp.]|jgi:hypothetical protein